VASALFFTHGARLRGAFINPIADRCKKPSENFVGLTSTRRFPANQILTLRFRILLDREAPELELMLA
jgi:hypothetical protein